MVRITRRERAKPPRKAAPDASAKAPPGPPTRPRNKASLPEASVTKRPVSRLAVARAPTAAAGRGAAFSTMGHGLRFIGRTSDLAHLAELETSARLITIHGAAGMGKTRLAREYARRVEEEKWVLFVDLTTCRTLEDAGIALAQAFAIPTTAGDIAAQVLEQAVPRLAARAPALVLLDNFEQLAEHAVEIVSPLLEAPGVTVLVTSRETLRMGDEAVHELEPLSLPALGGDARSSEALALLLDRVQRAGTLPSVIDVETCAEIVRELDGLPLALELAAPRIALLGAAEVRARLGSRLDVLTHAPRDAAHHQRTLRAAIDGSWNLLTPDEQYTFAQCSVFRGAFDLEAVTEIVETGASQSAIEAMQSLREKSLLLRAGHHPEARFALYISLREYAGEKLAADPDARARCLARHAAFYVRRGETLAAAAESVGAREALDRLSADREDLIAVVEHGLGGDVEALALGARAALALGPLFLARGPVPPFVARVERLIDAAAEAGIEPAVTTALHVLRGRCLHSRGAFAEAMAAQRIALVMAKSLGHAQLEARAFGDLTASVSRQNRPEDSLAMFMESAAQHRALGDRRREGIALRRASVFLRELGRLDEARETAKRSTELLHNGGDPAYEALAVTEVGYIALEEGDLHTARANAELGIRLAALSGHWLNKALVGGMLALVSSPRAISRAPSSSRLCAREPFCSRRALRGTRGRRARTWGRAARARRARSRGGVAGGRGGAARRRARSALSRAGPRLPRGRVCPRR